ncbi:hypothetical protein BJ742DRAFT_797164 [Cladochytrium replicatum]|nr:hypothetical protein BJ742DRAFT_797164 [Cladochytrium replicatum]
MPPKKPSGKSEAKAKAKSVEDKTFGLKNKNKSAKVAKYVQQVTQQADRSGNPKDLKTADDKKAAIAAKKKAEADKAAELAELFKPVQQQQKVPFGVDPKTILCIYFKSGQCQKGTKCKFSHDLNVERKDQKINVYEDTRNQKEGDTMENWDAAKLEDVINRKHGSDNANKNKPTDIVCKFFLEAIENEKYGWFWECPNGGKACKYRHALPPGYILKKKETEEERRAREEAEKENEISLEQFLDEEERHKLGTNLTPITYESFKAWKANRVAKAAAETAAQQKSKVDAFKQMRAGAKIGLTFSGRELFEFNPEMAQTGDDDEDGAMEVYEREDRDEDEQPPEAVARPMWEGEGGAVVDDEDREEDHEEETNGAGPSTSAGGPSVSEDLYDDLEGLDDDDDEEEDP